MILCVCPNPSVDTFFRINRIEAGGVNRITEQKEFPGGKGIHVAFGLNELDERSSVYGFWGGCIGNWLKERCAENEISCFGPAIKGANRKCYTLITSQKHSDLNNTELLEPGPSISEREYELFLEHFRNKAEDSDFICMSGSWPRGAPVTGYYDLINIANEKGKKVMLDASGIILQNALHAKPFGIHINMDEAKLVLPDGDWSRVLQYFSGYAELVALTMGEEGLYLCYKGKVFHANVHLSEHYSCVGSGDCLTAGIVRALQRNLPLAEIARWGVACGAANCLREDLGMFYKDDVDALLNEVLLNEVIL